MSEKGLKPINSSKTIPQDIKPKIGAITFQDLISFKEEFLKELREYKSKTTKNIDNEFDKYKVLIEKANIKMDYIEKEKASFLLKSEFVEEKNNIYSEISTKETELKKKLMLNEVQVTSCQKELENSIYKYDKAIIENLQVPGLVGNSCRFPNLKEYILTNKDELSICLNNNSKTAIEVKSFKKKTDMNITQINEKIKAQEYRLTNATFSKFNELKNHIQSIYEALDQKISHLTNIVDLEKTENVKEFENIKKTIKENNQKTIDNHESLKVQFTNEIEEINTKFHKIKKNIVNLSALLKGKKKGLKKKIMNNFNNMVKDLNTELNLNKNNTENNDSFNNLIQNNNSINNSENVKMSQQNNKKNRNSLSMKKMSQIKQKANSSIKDYIAGKISADDTKFNIDSVKARRKSTTFMNNNKTSFFNMNNGIINKNSSSTSNINISKDLPKNRQRLSLKMIHDTILMREKKEFASIFSENTKNIENEFNKKKKNSISIIKGSNKDDNRLFNKFYESINKNKDNFGKTNNDEIINEVDSNTSSDDSQKEMKDNSKKNRVKYKKEKKNDFNQKKISNKKDEFDSSEMSSYSKKMDDSSDSSKSDDNNYDTNKENNENETDENINNNNTNQENQTNLNDNSSNQNTTQNEKQNNTIKSINNYYAKTLYDNRNTNLNLEEENNNIIKNNLSESEKILKKEKSPFLLNKMTHNKKINLKRNIDIGNFNDNNSNKNNINILSLKKNKNKDMVQISPFPPNIINRMIQASYKTINSNTFNKNNLSLKNNNINKNANTNSKSIVFQNNDLMIKSSRNKKQNIYVEKDNNYPSFDNHKVYLNKNINTNFDMQRFKTDYNEIPRFKSDKKQR